MSDLDFKRIAPHLGSQQIAFEELCCQLAAKNRPVGSKFDRFYGAGGDGGVECIATLTDNSIVGWQAKYVEDVDSLIAQAEKSLATALSIHKTLVKYVVCFPFDLTGTTGRKTVRGRPAKSGTDKFNEWVDAEVAAAKKNGRNLVIEKWPAHELNALVLRHDASGGIRHYFFSAVTLTLAWFTRHVESAIATAGPRYTSSLSLETPMGRWFSSFAAETKWRKALFDQIGEGREKIDRLDLLVKNASHDPAIPTWPVLLEADGEKAVAVSEAFLAAAKIFSTATSEQNHTALLTEAAVMRADLSTLISKLRTDLETTHGVGKADSKRFREDMAAHQMTFPAVHLDAAREARKALSTFTGWLESPDGFLSIRKTFVLTGDGGAGKTHGICDVASKRLEKGAFTCVVFGHQFSGNPDPWTRLAESIGLPTTLGKDGVLDALSAAAQASGHDLIVCVDAINETQPRNYWQSRIAAFAGEITSRPSLKLCVSCRTSFADVCLPPSFAAGAVEHQGFAGMEREACNAFFHFYGLEAPLVPVLQPELSNPLYLKLVCQTLNHRGLKQLPSGWLGLAPVIQAFLDAKEEQFASDHSTSKGAGIVGGSLSAIATAIAASGNAALLWSQAQTVVEAKRPQAKGLQVVDWLIRADLLIEDGPPNPSLGGESVVRPAFERFGDFLVAGEMLAQPAPFDARSAFHAGGSLHNLCETDIAVNENAGVLAALSVLLAESPCGVELPDLLPAGTERDAVIELSIGSLPWRTPLSFSTKTALLVRECLARLNADEAMNALLSVATQPSAIDALWLDSSLRIQPLAKRDSFWSRYLRESFERGDIVLRLIDATRDIDLSKLDVAISKRWVVLLLWFTAAADRRVKDLATRAAVAILRAQPGAILATVDLFLTVDDDEVRERVLLTAYGALVLRRDPSVLKPLAESLLGRYKVAPTDFQNALIRDHIRCIAELAQMCGCLPASANPLASTTRNTTTSVPKPPSDAQIAAWEKLNPGTSLIEHSCLNDDFNHYSIGCLGDWMHAMDKPAIGGWIFARAVTGFDYPNSECSDYDDALTSQTGGGRGKPAWAERIGKKYQWLGLFQLASRLFDSVEAKKDSWARVTDRPPLILQDERKMDPTLTRPVVPEKESSECWWIPRTVDLATTKHLSDADWVNAKDDFPPIDAFVGPIVHEGKKWLPLLSYPKWTTPKDEREEKKPYRWMWVNLTSYLVPKDMFEDARMALEGRNFFNKWLPEGASWLHVFAGEYPWGTACNVETDGWLGYSDTVRNSTTKLKFVPVENEIVAEWQYDGSLPSSIHIQVPGRLFFEAGGLCWNGIDGFCTDANVTVFRDPAASEGGPASLIADFDDFRKRIGALGYRLVWTMLAEKTTLGDPSPTSPRITFSQVAYLNDDGSIGSGVRTFFKDFQKDTGLGPVKKSAAKK